MSKKEVARFSRKTNRGVTASVAAPGVTDPSDTIDETERWTDLTLIHPQ